MSRGCGDRKEGGLYLVCELSPYGMPVEHFLIDPAVPWNGPGLRSPLIQKDAEGVNHLIMSVGHTYYPYVSDFVEEVRVMGISKRIPRTFDLSVLSPSSKLLLVHPMGVQQFSYCWSRAGYPVCPKEKIRERVPKGHKCLGDLWGLGLCRSYKKIHEVSAVDGSPYYREARTPSCTYRDYRPLYPLDDPLDGYSMGIFMRAPISSFHLVAKKGKLPSVLKNQAQKAGIPLEVKPK